MSSSIHEDCFYFSVIKTKKYRLWLRKIRSIVGSICATCAPQSATHISKFASNSRPNCILNVLQGHKDQSKYHISSFRDIFVYMKVMAAVFRHMSKCFLFLWYVFSYIYMTLSFYSIITRWFKYHLQKLINVQKLVLVWFWKWNGSYWITQVFICVLIK